VNVSPLPADSIRPSSRPAEHRLRGILLRLIAVIAFSVMAALVKLLGERGVGPIELMFYRNLFALPLIIAWLAMGPGILSVRTPRWRAHATRAGIGMFSMVLTFQAVLMLPLSVVTTIGFAAPLFATVLSSTVLREHVGPHRWAAVAIGFLGVLVVMRPGGSSDLAPIGLLIGIGSALAISIVTITVRQIGQTEPATTTVFWFAMIVVVLGLFVMPFFARNHGAAEWGMLVGMGMIGAVAQLCMTSSLRFAPVAALAPFDYTQLLWAILLGWLFFSDGISDQTAAGAVLIIASGLYTVWRERKLHIERTPATPPIQE